MMVFEHTPAAWVIALSVGLALLLAAFGLWRFAPRIRAIFLLALLHLLFLLLLAWCLLLPGRRTVETHTLKPRFVVLLDTSKSMQLRPDEAVPTRWARAQEALARPWVKRVAADCEIDIHPFDASVGRKTALADLGGLAADGESTLLRDALAKVTGRYGGVNVVGGLLLSDGNDTREALGDWAAEARPFPLHTVMLEPAGAWKVEPDVRVEAVQTPRRVTVNWETDLRAVIAGQGTAGQTLQVGLYKDGVLQEAAPVQIPADGGARQVTFSLTHPDIGLYTYRVAVPPLPGESNTNDNEFAVIVQVIDARNRLIYVEGPPRWESKYLKRALQANRQATPLIFLQGPEGKPLALGPVGQMTADLTEQQLSFFKIVVVGNLDASELGDQRARNLIKFVETGGSLILLGGTKAWGDKGFSASPLKEILPARGIRAAPEEGVFRVALTPEGKTHAAFAGDPALWENIPPVLSVFPGGVLQPAASALVVAETPRGAQPIAVSQRYGQGKVVALLTDSLWKWQLHPNAQEAKPYQRFWDQLIAWLLPAEEEVEKDRLQLLTDRESLALGEEIRLSARFGGETADQTITVRCEITTPDGAKAPYSMRPEILTTATGKAYPGFATTYQGVVPGLHQVAATASVGGKTVTSDPLSFVVKAFSPELTQRPANPEVLKQIAAASGGLFFENLDALDENLSQLEVKQIEEDLSEYNSLWQRPLLLAFLILLAALGWVLRKMNNMP